MWLGATPFTRMPFTRMPSSARWRAGDSVKAAEVAGGRD